VVQPVGVRCENAGKQQLIRELRKPSKELSQSAILRREPQQKINCFNRYLGPMMRNSTPNWGAATKFSLPTQKTMKGFRVNSRIS
jgi:hypothetical protein